MDAEHAPVHASPVTPPAPEPPTAGEWTIGIAFVLGALGFVAWVGWAVWTLPH